MDTNSNTRIQNTVTVEPVDVRASAPAINLLMPMTKEQARALLSRPDNTPVALPESTRPGVVEADAESEDDCPDCGVAKYEKHEPYCSVAHCHSCGMRVANCFCAIGPMTAGWKGRDVVDEACKRFGFYCKPSDEGFVVCSSRGARAELDFCRLYSSGEAKWNRYEQGWELVKKRDLKKGHDSYGCIAARSKSNPDPTLLWPGKYWIGDPCYGHHMDNYHCWDTGSDGGAYVRRKRKILGCVDIETARVALFDFNEDINRPDLGVGIILKEPVVVIPHFISGDMQVGFEFGPYLVGDRK
jgi:hypothetical protein